jgi:hypothetical protein
MYWILFVMGTVVALVVAVLIGGLVTPRAHVASRMLTLTAAPEVVWALVRDVSRHAEWRSGLRASEIVDTDQPQLRWLETTTRGSMTFGVVRDEAPHLFAARILDDDLPFSGEWTWEVTPLPDGTRLCITERGAIDHVLFRFLAAHVFGYHRTIDDFLESVAKRLGQSAVHIEDGDSV